MNESMMTMMTMIIVRVTMAIDSDDVYQKNFLVGVNFYRFNAKNWHFRQILREKWRFFTDLSRKIGVFWCKFYSQKFLLV